MAAKGNARGKYRSAVERQVRNGQLDKEAGELRDENAQLERESEKLRSDAASGARVCLQTFARRVPKTVRMSSVAAATDQRITPL